MGLLLFGVPGPGSYQQVPKGAIAHLLQVEGSSMYTLCITLNVQLLAKSAPEQN